MFKLIKYELRGNFLTILGIFIAIIIGNLLLIPKRADWATEAITGFSVILSIVAITIIFISSLNLMSKYLHNDSGYLLFTLPQSGTKIILSRIITALIQINLVIIVASLGIYLATGVSFSFSFLDYITIKGIRVGIALYLCLNIYLLTFIYFCMIMGKVALRNKRVGKIGSFILFILLTLGMLWLESKLRGIFPQSLSVNYSTFFKDIVLRSENVTFIPINISNLIFEFLTFAAFFKGSTYMIDNKLDL